MDNKYTKYKNHAFTSEQWYVLKNAIEEGIDVASIANEMFDVEQLNILIQAKRLGIDEKVINDPAIPSEQMEHVLEHIKEDMGIYEEHYEKVRKTWLKNITWVVILACVVIVIGLGLLVNKDKITLYLTDLELSLTTNHEVLDAGTQFNALEYLKSYTDTAEITLPENINTNALGSQLITYKISNGARAMEETLVLEVVDKSPPSLILTSEYMVLEVNADFSCSASIQEAIDFVDGHMENKVTCSEFNPDKTSQSITYKVIDNAGNSVEKVQLVYKIQPKVENQPGTNIAPSAIERKEPASITVTAQNKEWIFKDGDDFKEIARICENEGRSAMDAKKANGFSCTPIPSNEIIGLDIGYSLKFK